MEISYRLSRPIELDVKLRVSGLAVLLGASGSGKTSLLRAVAGLLPASGTPFDGMPAHNRPVGYLPQHYALFPHLSAFENVCFPMKHVARAGRERRAMELLVSLGVAHCTLRKPATLSGGEKQRVALARALARDPELLLLDEPLSAVDTPTSREIVGWLSETITRLGIPALVATHSPLMATAADTIAILQSGHIVQHGEREAVMRAPVSVHAARLLGYSNVLHAELEPTGAIRTALGIVPRPGDCRGSDDVCVAFRPETAWVVPPGAKSPVEDGKALRASCEIQSVSPPYCRVNLQGVTIEALLSPNLADSDARHGSIMNVVISAGALRVLAGGGLPSRSRVPILAASADQNSSSSPK